MAAGADVFSTAGGTADMIGAVDFSDINSDTGVDLTPDAGAGDLGAPEGIEDPTVEEPIVEELPDEPTTEEPEPEPPAATDLPEGVREISANGKKEMRLTPARYETFHQAHRTLRDFEQVIGEPITPEILDVRNRAFNGQERLYGDLTSGDAKVQSQVLNHFIDEATRAYEEGEVGTDPVVTLGQAMYDTLQQRSPDAFAHVRMRAAGDLVNEMYAEAQRAGDKNLALGVSHMARALGLPYKKDTEITQYLATPPANADPVANLRAENQRLQQQINERQSASAAEQWNKWKGDARKTVTSSVSSEAVMPSLSEAREAWKDFPNEFDTHVVAPLNKAVRDTLLADKNFTGRIAHLEKLAQRATSEQKRQEYAGQIRQAYVNRARLAVDAHKVDILREAATVLKKGNDTTHARRQNAQQQRGPRGLQSPAPRSLVPGADVVNPGGVFNAKTEAARLAQLLG